MTIVLWNKLNKYTLNDDDVDEGVAVALFASKLCEENANLSTFWCLSEIICTLPVC